MWAMPAWGLAVSVEINVLYLDASNNLQWNDALVEQVAAVSFLAVSVRVAGRFLAGFLVGFWQGSWPGAMERRTGGAGRGGQVPGWLLAGLSVGCLQG
jgi:hypothetical protein